MHSAKGISKKFFHLTWFSDVHQMNPTDPKQKREWIQIVLERGKSRDVRKLDASEIRTFFPSLHLSPATKSLWQNYFSGNK